LYGDLTYAKQDCTFYRNGDENQHRLGTIFFERYQEEKIIWVCEIGDQFDVFKLHRKRTVLETEVSVFWKWCTSTGNEALGCIDQNSKNLFLDFDDSITFMSMYSEKGKLRCKDTQAWSPVQTRGIRVEEFQSIVSYYSKLISDLSLDTPVPDHFDKADFRPKLAKFLEDAKDFPIDSIIFRDYSFPVNVGLFSVNVHGTKYRWELLIDLNEPSGNLVDIYLIANKKEKK